MAVSKHQIKVVDLIPIVDQSCFGCFFNRQPIAARRYCVRSDDQHEVYPCHEKDRDDAFNVIWVEKK